MATYNLHTECSRILQDVLIASPALNILPSIKEAAKKVRFTGGDRPFLPTPMKMTESSSALNALVAAGASAVATDRYGIDPQDIEVNTDLATLFLESVLLPTINGKHFNSDPKMREELSKMELHDQTSLIRRHATGVYQTKDGRWYQLHSSMNADPTMEMMGVTNQDVTREEAVKIWSEKVAQWDSAEIEKVANEKYRQAGAVCYTPEEFFSSEQVRSSIICCVVLRLTRFQGNIMGQEPLWTTRPIAGGGKAWPKPSGNPADHKPLAGVRVIDFSRVIAAPAISKKLAVLGADVIRISHSGNPDYAATMIDLQTGKRDADLNVKTPEGKQAFIELLKGADVLVDGFRPGAFERLGFTSESLREINPSLIYVRENCYGFKGPLSYRSGWQQVSDCLVGISYLQGKFLGLEEAVLPLFRE
jgi:crotonobetainyl-CoA:carnitine CoA-transferase CaiB-like acyl-CoA transferase